MLFELAWREEFGLMMSDEKLSWRYLEELVVQM